MKYYYKKPEDFVADQARKREETIQPYRNRTFMVIFIDIIIIVLAFGMLWFFGVIGGPSEREREFLAGSESVMLAFSARSEVGPTWYLYVRNNGERPIDFVGSSENRADAADASLQPIEATLSVYDETMELLDQMIVELDPRSISPNEVSIYRFRPASQIDSNRQLIRFEFLFQDQAIMVESPSPSPSATRR